MTTAVDAQAIDRNRRERLQRLAVFEIPLIRVAGSAILSTAVFLHNRYLLGTHSTAAWLDVTLLLGFYAIAAWTASLLLVRGERPRDPTVILFAGDLAVWTYAIYATGAERSWLFFILLMRIADQVQTTVRRCLLFAALATMCWLAMLAWVVLADDRAIDTAATVVKTVFLVLSGIYISLAARTAESRRAQLTAALRDSRDLNRQFETQSLELRDAHTRAQEASAAKSEFLANMSHEMRTPLHGVIGMLQLAIDDEPSPQRARRLDLARRSAETLLATIDDILDFSKIEARKIELEPVYFSLRDLLRETMQALGGSAAVRRLTLIYSVDADVPDIVWGDPLRVRQVVVNLVANSIKFTPAGEVSLRVMRDAAAADHLRFDVRDTGIGVDPALRDRIFEPFTQADNSPARRVGGTGLGLSIVARLVEAMGGSITLLSRPGEGSSFAFSIALPADPVGAAPRQPAWAPLLSGKSVLLIEPNATSRAVLTAMLRARGVFVTACSDAAEAPEGRYLCTVTADAEAEFAPKVIISSPLDEIDDSHVRITRPVDERELLEAIGEASGLSPEAATFALAPRPSPQRSLRILLAEDNPVGQLFASESLERLGHIVTMASDGLQALDALTREQFDVVLLDVQMPLLDGTEVAQRYRASGGSAPIIALTAHTSREDRERCLAAGMNDVITKPVAIKRLADALASVTGSDTLLEVVGGNARLLARVSEAFAEQTPLLLATMHQAITSGDAEELYRAAHKLKGSVAHLHDPVAAPLSADIETAARANDLDRAAALMPRLEAAVGELERRLQLARTSLR